MAKTFKEQMMEHTIGKKTMRKITRKHEDYPYDRSWSPEAHERAIEAKRNREKESNNGLQDN